MATAVCCSHSSHIHSDGCSGRSTLACSALRGPCVPHHNVRDPDRTAVHPLASTLSKSCRVSHTCGLLTTVLVALLVRQQLSSFLPFSANRFVNVHMVTGVLSSDNLVPPPSSQWPNKRNHVSIQTWLHISCMDLIDMGSDVRCRSDHRTSSDGL
ncbi:hypothetical protein BC629DRAFT_422530 [Irpex lacteus]|nr:hypothetical protein BC629DRAFT_422530 [Irpex lacteus]